MSQAQITLPRKTDDSLHQLSEFVAFRWINDGVAFEVTTTSSEQEDVAIYIEANMKAISQWDKAQPFYSIQNISDPNIRITGYFKARLDEVAKLMKEKEIRGTSMIVMNADFTGQMMKILARFFVNKINNKIQQVWLTDINKAYAELDKRLAVSY